MSASATLAVTSSLLRLDMVMNELLLDELVLAVEVVVEDEDEEPDDEELVPALTESPTSPLTVTMVPANGAVSLVSSSAS